MSKNILAIDIGASSVKIAQFNKSLKGIKLTHFAREEYEQPCGPDSFFDAAIKALKELFTEELSENDLIVSSFSSRALIVRNMTFPFTDKKKIGEILKYEIEPDILFQIDDLIVDFLLIKKGTRSDKKSDVLAAAVEKKTIDEHLRILKELDVEPDILYTDSFALWSCYCATSNVEQGSAVEKSLRTDKEGIISVIDIGAGKTSVNIIEKGKLLFIRAIPKGGNFITEKIMKDMGITFSEAEQMKRDAVLSDDEKVSASIESGVLLLLKDIELTFFSYQSRAKQEKIKKIVLTGGGSQIKNLTDKFEERFNVKVEHYDLHDYLDDDNIAVLPSEENIYSPVSIGLGLKGAGRSRDTVNFRKEEFVLKKSYEDIKGSLFWISFQAAVIFFLIFFDIYYSFKVKINRYDYLKTEVRSIFKEAFPEVKKIVSEVAQMKSKIKKNEKKLKAFGGVAGIQMSSLELLRNMSANIPGEIKIKIKDMTITQEIIRFSGNTDSFDALDNLKKNLEQSNYFEEFKIDNASAGTDEETIKFKASIVVAKNIQ